MGFKKLPKTANTVRKIVKKYSNRLRNSIISEIFDKKLMDMSSEKDFLYPLMNGRPYEISTI